MIGWRSLTLYAWTLVALASGVLAGGDVPPGSAGKILFVRGGPGTGGFLEGGADEQLSDVFDLSTSSGNHGWGQLGQLLTSNGYVIDQAVEGPVSDNTPVDLAAIPLSQYAIVVLGSNNADYSPSAVDLIEEYVRNGGGLLVISDANWGTDWGDAPSSDQPFLDRFGLVMNQDTGQYVLSRADGDFVVGGVDQGAHPILIGSDGLPGTADDVNQFDGEGVSPITVVPNTRGFSPRVLARAEGSIHVNDSAGSGSFRPVTEADGALVVLDLGGRVACHFDRNTFFNENGAGTSLVRFDNTQYALNLFAWLAGPPSHSYGRAKVNSLGLAPTLEIVGEPSAAVGGFRIQLSLATPLSAAVAFHGSDYADLPFQGGTLLVGGRIVRLEPFQTDATGVGTTGFRFPPEAVCESAYFQVWYRDPLDPMGFGVGLSEGLRVRLGP